MLRVFASGLLSCAALVAVLGPCATLAAGPKASLNAYFPVDFKDAGYQKRCLDKVLGSWAPSGQTPRAGSKTVVQSSIGRDGKLIAARVTMRSGSEAWDAAALKAVQKAAPFPPLPAAHRGAQVEVHWHFNAG